MGIRQYFLRVSRPELLLLQENPDAIYEITQAVGNNECVFWPLSEYESFDNIRKLCVEKSYWSLLNDLVKIEVAGDLCPTWDTVEGGTPIEGSWCGYGPLRFLRPHEVRQVTSTMERINEVSLRRRFEVLVLDWQVSDDVKKNFGLAGLECHQVLTEFLRSAAQQGQALVWYII